MKKSYKILTVTTLLAAMALLGIPMPTFAQSPQRFTGEQVYRGIVFGEAPVSYMFPGVWGTDVVKKALDASDRTILWNDLKEQVITQIQADDPTFLTRFGEDTQTGDHLRVQAAFDEAIAKTLSAFQSLGYLDNDGNPSDGSGECLVRIAVAAYIVAVVAIAYALVFIAGPRIPGVEESSLYREMLVNFMTERLAPTS